MTLGIECLLTDDPARAAELAPARSMGSTASGATSRPACASRRRPLLESPDAAKTSRRPRSSIFDPEFHEGVVGIVASRLKDRLHRPTFVFALGQDGALKGSGRSIPGFHLRDALDLVSKRHPGVLKKFGGHAMAAGCTLAEEDFDTFEQAFALVAHEWLDAEPARRARLATDGPLDANGSRPRWPLRARARGLGPGLRGADVLRRGQVVSQRLVGEKHLKLALRHGGLLRDAIWFGRVEPVPERTRLAYRLSVDEYNGAQRVQMVIEASAD